MPIEIDLVKYLKDGTVLLRCECQATFTRKARCVRIAERNGVALKCPWCDPNDRAGNTLMRFAGVRGFREKEPRTAKAKECVRLMSDGVNYIEAAAITGMAAQSAEKLYFRWIVYPENVRLKTENEQLRARLVAAGVA